MNCVPAQIAMSVFLNVMPFEVVVVGGLDVEQIEVAAAVDDHLAVARRLDHDRLLRRAVGRQVIRPLERRRRVDRRLVGVELVAIRVGAGVHQDRVAGLDARPSARRGVAGAAVVVVGAHDAGERRLGLRAGVADRIDVIHLAALGRLRLGTRADGDRLGRVRGRPAHAIRIGQHEARFIRGVRLEIEDAAREHVRRHEREHVRLRDPLALQPQQRHAGLPRAVAGFPVRHVDFGVAIRIAVDPPFEAEVDQRRRFDDEFAGRDASAAAGGCCAAPTLAEQNREAGGGKPMAWLSCRRILLLYAFAVRMYSSTFFASTSSGTLPPSTTRVVEGLQVVLRAERRLRPLALAVDLAVPDLVAARLSGPRAIAIDFARDFQPDSSR